MTIAQKTTSLTMSPNIKFYCKRCESAKTENDFSIAPTAKERTTTGTRFWCDCCVKIYTDEYQQELKRRLRMHKFNQKEHRRKNKDYVMWKLAKERAAKKGILFTITKEDIRLVTHCPVLGIELCYENDKLLENSPTLDRTIPDLGYVPDNVQVMSWKANRMKQDGTMQDFENLIAYMRRTLVVGYRTIPENTTKKLYTYNGETLLLIDWARKYKMSYSTLNSRVNKMHWELEKALLTPVAAKNYTA